MGTLYSPKLEYYCSLTFILFSIIYRTLVGGVLPVSGDVVGVFNSLSRQGEHWFYWKLLWLFLSVIFQQRGEVNLIVNRTYIQKVGVRVKAMDCGIVVREFVLQSRYYVHFRANTLGKGMNPLILPAMG